MIQPFILRRSKRDVEKQLPKKYEHILKCRLSGRQKNMYEDILTQPGSVSPLTASPPPLSLSIYISLSISLSLFPLSVTLEQHSTQYLFVLVSSNSCISHTPLQMLFPVAHVFSLCSPSPPRAQEALKTGHFVSVLQVLMQLQRVCNHPDLVTPRETSSSYVCAALQYHTPSLVLGALQDDPWKVGHTHTHTLALQKFLTHSH